jgi:hypothetical protein
MWAASGTLVTLTARSVSERHLAYLAQVLRVEAAGGMVVPLSCEVLPNDQRADISGAMPTARAGASASPQSASQFASIW